MKNIYTFTLFALLICVNNLFPQDFWQPTNVPGSYGKIYSIVFHPNTTSTLLAGTETGGILKSTDSGDNWFQSNTGLSPQRVNKIYIRPDGNIYAGTSQGVYYSTDLGNSWLSQGLLTNIIDIASLASDYLFAATNSGVARSTNNGTTWSYNNSGLLNTLVKSILILPNGEILAALGSGNGQSGGIYKSTNNGNNWVLVQVHSSWGAYFAKNYFNNSIYCFPVSNNVSYKSTDNGNSWIQFTTGSDERTDGLIHYSSTIFFSARNLFFTDYAGVYHSTDNGLSWYQMNSGLNNLNVYSMGILPNGVLLAGVSDGGIYKSVLYTTEPDIQVNPTSLTLPETNLNRSKEKITLDKNSLINLTQPYLQGELIVKVKASMNLVLNESNFDGVGAPIFNSLFEKIGVYQVEKIYKRKQLPPTLENTILIKFPKTFNLEYVIAELMNKEQIEWVHPNYIHQISSVPNDPSYISQWHLAKVRAAESWDLGIGSSSIIIGIIDTGVDWNHTDLSGNIWINTDEIDGNGIDDDGNGYIDDVRGWDWVTGIVDIYPGEDGETPDNDPMDFQGHGTHCSGIASASTNNGIGVSGMGNGCSIMALRAGWANSSGGGNLSSSFILSAIDYAIDNGAKVISMSFTASSVFLTAVTDAYNNGIVVVHAAGNDNSNIPSSIDGIIQTISVAATDPTDAKSSGSNYGSWIDISAPGENILSTTFDDSYGYKSGTSMSTPLVAGLAGLILSQNSSLTPEEVTNIITSSADNIDNENPSYIGQLGAGRMNAFLAMQTVTGSNNLISIESIGTGILNINSITSDKTWLNTAGYPTTPFEIFPGSIQVVNCSVDWNQVSAQETGTITISSNDPDEDPVYVSVTAIPLPDPALCISTTSWDAPSAGGTSGNIDVTNCGNLNELIFDATPSETWLTVSIPHNTTPGYFEVTAEPNGTGSIRNGTVTVSAAGASPIILNVIQSSCNHGWVAVTNQQNNMNVIAQLEFDGVVTLNESDAIGAFVGSECRGIAYPLSASGGLIFLTISSNQLSGETVTFKSWKSSTCEELSVLETIDFVNQALVGSLADPFIFHCGMVELAYNFGSGFTWFSINIDPGNMAINSVFNGLSASANDRIIGQTNFAIYDASSGQWIGSLVTIDPKKMYILNSASGANFTLQGLPLNPSTNPISLDPGWTWIGYLPRTSIAINLALANMTATPASMDRFVSQNQFAVYDQGSSQWIGSLMNLNPGNGYKTQLTNATVLTYPSNTTAPLVLNDPIEKILEEPNWVPVGNLQNNMQIIGEIVWNLIVSSNPNDKIGAFVGSECRGVAYNNISTANGYRFFLTVGSNQQAGENVTFKVYNAELDQVDENPDYPPVTFQNLAILGTIQNPFTVWSALPVEMTSFTAKVSEDQIDLNWETKTEVNNYGFEVERSITLNNENTTWQKIGFVQGNGNSNSPKSYNFTDNNPIGGSKFVYRLKQIDTDGAYEYSTEVEVELLPTEYELYQNYPNPFNPVTNIKFSLPVQTQLKINLYNMLGELVATIVQGTFESGYHMVTLNASNLPSGTYIYRLESSEFVQVKKLLILK
ncbi:MAG: S8 family serine peptidase [bacterium]|nr:S8 family serine peptidase [bacterium]